MHLSKRQDRSINRQILIVKCPTPEWAKLVQMVEATSANVPAMLKHLNISLPDNNLRLLGQNNMAASLMR